MKIEFEIPCEVHAGEGIGHSLKLSLDTESSTLQIATNIQTWERYVYVKHEYLKFNYRFVPVANLSA